jgi:hypothetical protein
MAFNSFDFAIAFLLMGGRVLRRFRRARSSDARPPVAARFAATPGVFHECPTTRH